MSMTTAPVMPSPPATEIAPSIAPTWARIPEEDHAPWRMSVALYERIVQAGLLEEFGHVYLWNGRLCERMGSNRPHVYGVKSVFLGLYELRLNGYSPETEAPTAFRFNHCAPQPDVKVVRGQTKDSMERMPTTAEIALVIEVADTSLFKDRALALTYAIEEIPVYWLLNLSGRRLEVYSVPIAGVYTSVTFFEPEQDVPVVLDGREVGRVRVGDVLP